MIPLHYTPKLFKGAPQSPVSHMNLPSLQLHPVLAQNLIATVFELIIKVSSAPGAISHPVLVGKGTPNPPIHIL